MSTKAHIEERLAYLYSLTRFGMRMGLEVTEALCEGLGRPERQIPSVHVTGTNGKGSTCALIDSVLRAAGYRVGLYTSPHLYRFHERIRIGGIPVSDEGVIRLIDRVDAVARALSIQPTFFEFTTAMAFSAFADEKVDIMVLEAGLGGPIDAVNIVSPLVSVITNIGLDHTDVLGATKTAIAREETGIIKHGVPVVTNDRSRSILNIIRRAAHKHEASLLIARQCVLVRAEKESLDGQRVSLIGLWAGSVMLPLLGSHQRENLATALAVLSILRERGFPVAWRDVVRGIEATVWEGRIDVVMRKPLVIVDGAHNNDGIRALDAFVRTLPRPDVLVLGVKKGRDVTLLNSLLVPRFLHVITTEGSFQPERADVLARSLSAARSVQIVPSPDLAVHQALELAGKHATVVITGSLYMIADALSFFRNKHRRPEAMAQKAIHAS